MTKLFLMLVIMTVLAGCTHKKMEKQPRYSAQQIFAPHSGSNYIYVNKKE